MIEIYLVETLTSLCIGFLVATVVTGIFAILYAEHESECDDDVEKAEVQKRFKKCIISASILFVLFILTPSTSTGYKILGIGGTIDYLRQNETAKQLPDKCIKALDLWIDEIAPDKGVVNDSIRNK